MLETSYGCSIYNSLMFINKTLVFDNQETKEYTITPKINVCAKRYCIFLYNSFLKYENLYLQEYENLGIFYFLVNV